VATLLDDGSWDVQGRRLQFPVRITAATAAFATYLVRTARAGSLVSGTGLQLVSVAGRTPLFLGFVTYRAGDLDSYHEVAVALLARHRGRVGPYIHQLPVTQTFTMEAGRALWGLPKWLARAELDITGRDATCHLTDDADRHVLTASLRTLPWRIPLTIPGALTALAHRSDQQGACPGRRYPVRRPRRHRGAGLRPPDGRRAASRRPPPAPSGDADRRAPRVRHGGSSRGSPLINARPWFSPRRGPIGGSRGDHRASARRTVGHQPRPQHHVARPEAQHLPAAPAEVGPPLEVAHGPFGDEVIAAVVLHTASGIAGYAMSRRYGPIGCCSTGAGRPAACIAMRIRVSIGGS
jgi:hypothetical protein